MFPPRSAYVAVLGLCLTGALLPAQESPVRRAANIVIVAVEEYAKGVDDKGHLTAESEYQEAIGFLKDAKLVTDRLTGERAGAARALLDSIITAAQEHKPPQVLVQLEDRFSAALGSEAALELPKSAIHLAEGRADFERVCAACHGPLGAGDGPEAVRINPRPAPIGNSKLAAGLAPAMMYRVISVGISGTAMVGFAGSLTAEQRWGVVSYLTSLRSTPAGVADGEGLYTQRCAQCHGASGAGDGASANALSKLPPEIGSFVWQANRSDDSLALMIRDGVHGTPMPPAGDLTDTQARSVVAYLRTLPQKTGGAVALNAGADSGSSATAARNVSALLEQALTAFRLGHASEAGDKAFDAYIAFEPLEVPARAKNPGKVASMERLFAEFKAAVHGNDLRGAERVRDAIEVNMQEVVDLTRSTGSAIEAFSQSLLIIVREGFEAILVIGAIVALLLKTGHRERMRSIWTGVALGLIASGVTAVVLRTILVAMPASQEILEGLTLLVAVGVLFSVSYWLISKVEAANWQRFIREKVTHALQHGGGKALAFVAFLAVYREGAETALFYQALFNEGGHVALPISLGIIAGGVALAIIFTCFYRFGVSIIPLRPFFGVTSVMLYYMAFVFMGKGMRELQEGGAVPTNVIHGFPTVEALGLYPTWETLLAQLMLLALFVFAVAKTFWPKRSVALPTILPEPAITDGAAAALDQTRGEVDGLAARVASLEETVRRLSSANRESQRR